MRNINIYSCNENTCTCITHKFCVIFFYIYFNNLNSDNFSIIIFIFKKKAQQNQPSALNRYFQISFNMCFPIYI